MGSISWGRGECPTCEILRIELDHARREKQLLLEALVERVKPNEVAEIQASPQDEPLRPISMGRNSPHKIRAQMIRENDEQLLNLMKNSKKEMAEARQAQIESVGEDTKKEEIELLERNILGVKNG